MQADPAEDDVLTIRCPACGATQTARPVCRRCHADLELVVRVSESSRLARRRLERAVAEGDDAARARLDCYLRWLHG